MSSASCSARRGPSPSARYCPGSAELDAKADYDRSIYERMGAAGFLGLPIPERYGGAGMDYIAFALLCEEMERADTAFRVILSVHTGLNSLTLLQWGSEEQKERFLVPQARGEKLATFGLTEPGVGSDAGNLSSTARLARRQVHPQRRRRSGSASATRPITSWSSRPVDKAQGPSRRHRLHRRARIPRLQQRIAARQAGGARREHRESCSSATARCRSRIASARRARASRSR